MLQSHDLDQRAYSDLLFNSWEMGWRSLLLRHLRMHPNADDVVIPPVAEQGIFLMSRGASTVESGSEGTWHSAASRAGQISMTAPDRPSRLRWRSASDQPIESIQLYVPAATTARQVEELWDRDPVTLVLPDALATVDPVVEQSILALLRAAQSGAPDLYAEVAAEFLTVHTLVHYGTMPAPMFPGGEDQRVRRAQSFIRENLHRPISLAEIAAEADLSRYHFLRVFRDRTGETPQRYLIRFRIERGQDELLRSTRSVSEIAVRCGFSSPASFSTAFRRQTGYSPTAFRQRFGPSVR